MKTRTWSGFLLAGWSVLAAGVGAAGAATPGGPAPGMPALTASFLDSLWTRVYGPLSNALGSQDRLIQFAAVGMVAALFLIWWRK